MKLKTSLTSNISQLFFLKRVQPCEMNLDSLRFKVMMTAVLALWCFSQYGFSSKQCPRILNVFLCLLFKTLYLHYTCSYQLKLHQDCVCHTVGYSLNVI